MQTFLPHSSLRKSAQALDYRRLGKQRVECLQLLRAIKWGGAWSNHPAARMWRQYVPALARYGQICVEEWVRRGYLNTMDFSEWLDAPAAPPYWLGDERLHASHRSNLLRKDPTYYGQFHWSETPDLPYIWPAEYPEN